MRGLIDKALIEAELCRRSLHEFGRRAWSIVEPTCPFIENWHNGVIAEHLQACAQGELQNLVINVPPGTAKSLWGSVLFPAWIWTWSPGSRGLYLSWHADLATRDSMRTQTILTSGWYKSRFSGPRGWKLDPRQHEKTYYWNTSTGFRQSDTMQGSTGWRVNAIVADDPTSIPESWNPKRLRHVNAVWDQALHNRVANPARDCRIVIMQRQHKEDLAGHLLARGDFAHLCLPSEYNPKRSRVLVTRTGRELQTDQRTEPGDVLFPQLQPSTYLQSERVRLGLRAYAAQHLQEPSVEGGGLFRRAWWRFWKPDGRGVSGGSRPHGCYEGAADPLPEPLDQIGIYVDAAFKKGDETDFVVLTVIGFKGSRRYVLDRTRRRLDYGETKRQLVALVERWRADPLPHKRVSRVVIEDKANGPAIVSELRGLVPGLVAWNPGQDSKESRAQFVSPTVESGDWLLPDGAPWLDDWITEFEEFPTGDNDDQVDTLSMAELSTGVKVVAARLRALGQM